MCGRYAFYDHQELSERLTNVSLDTNFLEHFRPTWNAAPSQNLPVIVEDRGKVEVRVAKRGPGTHFGRTHRSSPTGLGAESHNRRMPQCVDATPSTSTRN